MDVEYEAMFPNVDKEQIREKLKELGGKLIRPEFLQRRYNFSLPGKSEIDRSWLRVRDEGDKITFSHKQDQIGGDIESQKEYCVEINNMEKMRQILEGIGCKMMAYQETRRELWELDGIEVTIDEWPFIEPLVEIEGKNEAEVRKVAEKIGFDWSHAIFSSVTQIYVDTYDISWDLISNHTPIITFDMDNPFK